MPVAVEMTFRDATLEQYDAVNERIGLVPGGVGPEHLLFHWAAKTEDGLRVVDVWDSRESYGAHVAALGPIFASVGIPQPEVATYDVHNIAHRAALTSSDAAPDLDRAEPSTRRPARDRTRGSYARSEAANAG